MKKQNTSIEPYPASWIHRFVGWVDDFFVPPWLFYSGLFLLHGLINHLVNWQEGLVQSGTIDIRLFLRILQPYGILILHHYFESASRDALRDTRPMLGVTDDEFLKLEYEFSVLPVRQFMAWSMVGLALGVFFFFYTEPSGASSLYVIVTLFLGYVPNGMLAFGFAYRMIRMLRMIDSVFASAQNVGLFMLSSVYALSTLSAKVGGSAFVLLYISSFTGPQGVTDLGLGMVIIGSLIPLAVLFLPLRGINRRLVDEKQRLLFDVSQRLESALNQINQAFDKENHKKIGELDITLRALTREKELLDKIPTWPWRPATIRVFLSAILLPIFLWLIQQILERVFSF